MIVRGLEPKDLEQIIQIHGKFYNGEFSIEDFFNKLVDGSVIENNGRIVVAGGVRPILEIVNITDKDASVRERRDALYMLLDKLMKTSARMRFEQLHVFIQDEQWKQHLIRAGFIPTKGQALVIFIG